MIKKNFFLAMFVFIFSCSNIEFILKEEDGTNRFKDKVLVVSNGNWERRFVKELYSVFGNNTKNEFILITTFVEKKENRIVKKNQVAERVDYFLEVNYELFYKTKECKIYNKKVVSTFSVSPKSFGYNFGADQSFEELYAASIKKNIQKFIRSTPNNNSCV